MSPRRAHHWTAPLLLALGCLAGVAHAEDPLHAAACVEALDALRQADGALLRAVPAASAASAADSGDVTALRRQVLALRKSAAQRCLGASDDTPAPRRELQAPLSVPGVPGLVLTVRPRPAAAAGAVTPAPPAVRSVTACDANGCWASDGTRLQKIGPQLLGPSGFCGVTAGVLHCP